MVHPLGIWRFGENRVICLGDMIMRGKERLGSYGLTVDPTGCETDWNASDWSLVDTLLNTPPTKKFIRD
jgi:hypothetical protein